MSYSHILHRQQSPHAASLKSHTHTFSSSSFFLSSFFLNLNPANSVQVTISLTLTGDALDYIYYCHSSSQSLVSFSQYYHQMK
jgi:hypothetical protein